VHVALEAFGSESLLPAFGSEQRTLALAASARWRPAHGVDLWLGLARSVAPGAARTDDVRVIAGVAWAPMEPPEEPAARAEVAPVVEQQLVDTDGDGIPDVHDACPNEAEDRDGFRDDDGCPDIDNDGDGIPDAQDRCPNEPETMNGIDDQDGCPDQGSTPSAPFELPAPLRFAHGQASLPAGPEGKQSRAALEHFVYLLYSHPEVKHIRIEAHAAAEPHAQALSQARADGIRAWLIGKGIDPQRLQAVGYGDSRPLGTPEESRRVEIIQVDR
jgi:outer membrane protein OmpA-like peptidoglycan-associated protein